MILREKADALPLLLIVPFGIEIERAEGEGPLFDTSQSFDFIPHFHLKISVAGVDSIREQAITFKDGLIVKRRNGGNQPVDLVTGLQKRDASLSFSIAERRTETGDQGAV